MKLIEKSLFFNRFSLKLLPVEKIHAFWFVCDACAFAHFPSALNCTHAHTHTQAASQSTLLGVAFGVKGPFSGTRGIFLSEGVFRACYGREEITNELLFKEGKVWEKIIRGKRVG